MEAMGGVAIEGMEKVFGPVYSYLSADKSRKGNNPAYERPKRYVTVFGETQEVITEVEMDEVKAGGSWLQGNAGHMEHMDSVKFTVLKEIDDYDE